MAATYRLGVVADPMPGHSQYEGMIAIPYLDRNASPLTVRFRCFQDHDHRAHFHGKYNSIKDDPPRMFNVGAIHRASDEIHVTEGEFDAMVLDGLGLHAVAIPGASMWGSRHRRMLAGFSTAWIWADPDESGAKLLAKITRSLRSAKAVRLRADVTDTYIADGADALMSLIAPKAAA